MKVVNKILVSAVAWTVGWLLFGMGMAYVPEIRSLLYLPIGFVLGILGQWYFMKFRWAYFADLWEWRFKQGYKPEPL